MNNAGIALTLRPLARSDFPLLARWLEEPAVKHWWNHESTPEALERDFGASIDGTDPAEIAVAELDGTPFGLIQRYTFADEPAYAAELAPLIGIPPGAISLDYLIGEPEFRGRGLGAAMISMFAMGEAIVPVSARNEASWRALERAGFVRVAEGELEPDNPAESRAHVVYRRR